MLKHIITGGCEVVGRGERKATGRAFLKRSQGAGCHSVF